MMSGADFGLRVIAPGPLATVQDLGRDGRASLGVSRSGGLDRGALRLANRLVGNPESAAGIEITAGGFRATAERDLWFALTGAWGPVRLSGRPVDPYAAHRWAAGATLEIDAFTRGLRGYLGVRGGVVVPTAVGSRSTDVLAGLGPPPLAAGSVLPIGGIPAAPVPPSEIAPWSGPADGVVELEASPGPRASWFAASALASLFDAEWVVTADADRVGIRLEGPSLPRLRDGELPSEGMLPGAMQVPPSGRPTILLADGPVTGGYPVLAVVADR